MSKELEKIESDVMQINALTYKDVKNFFCAGATDGEVELFLRIARGCQLNPFKREIYLVKYGTYPASIMTGYEVYLQRAEASKVWNGYKVWTEGSGADLVAKIEVYRKDWDKPLYHEVYYEEYVQKTKDGSVNRFWKEKPRTMLKKVAVSQAFRLAFPETLHGLPYIQEEINEVQTNVFEEPEMPMPKALDDNPKTEQPQPQPQPEKTEETVKVKEVNKTNIIYGVAKGSGPCELCEERIDSGSEVGFDTKKKKFYHKTCVPPDLQ